MTYKLYARYQDTPMCFALRPLLAGCEGEVWIAFRYMFYYRYWEYTLDEYQHDV